MTSQPILRCVALIAGIVLLCLSLVADAHRLRPAIVTLTVSPDEIYTGTIQLNLEAVVAGVGIAHDDTDDSPQSAEYNRLRALTPAELRNEFTAVADEYLAGVNLRFDETRSEPAITNVEVPAVGDVSTDRISTLQIAGAVPPGATTMTWQYAERFGENALRIAMQGSDPIRSAWLGAGQRSEVFDVSGTGLQARTRLDVFGDYTVLGFTHILPKGVDHILFVLGMFLLSLKWRPLLYQVTAFTVAHSITLALSLFEIVSLPPSIVEPLIALSIVYVAVENLVTRDLKPWRIYVVFAFGLLHGLGFAGVLTELGLPRSEFVTALIGFNVGVELGQLAVITLAFAAVGLWAQRTWYRGAVIVPGSLAIAAVGMFWTVERVLG